MISVSTRVAGRAVLVASLRRLTGNDAIQNITHALAMELYHESRDGAPFDKGNLKDSHDVVRAPGGGWTLEVRANHAAPVMARQNAFTGTNFVREAMKEVLGGRGSGQEVLDRAMQAEIARRGLGR